MNRAMKAVAKGCMYAFLVFMMLIAALTIIADQAKAQVAAEVTVEITAGTGYRELDKERYAVAYTCAQHFMVQWGKEFHDPRSLKIIGEDAVTGMMAIKMYHDPRLGISLCSNYQDPKLLDLELFCFGDRELTPFRADKCAEVNKTPPIPEGTLNLLTTPGEE